MIVRQVNLDSGQFVAPGEDTAGQKGCGELAVAQNPTPIRQLLPAGSGFILFAIIIMKFSRLYCPLRSKGKSMMYGLIALATDGRTVKDPLYYQQTETPCWSARDRSEWRRQWPDKMPR